MPVAELINRVKVDILDIDTSTLVSDEPLRTTVRVADDSSTTDVIATPDLVGKRDLAAHERRALASLVPTVPCAADPLGDRGIFPSLLTLGTASAATMPAPLGADIGVIDNVLAGRGVPAEAFRLQRSYTSTAAPSVRRLRPSPA